MSSSSDEDIPVDLAQEIREQQIVRRFDFGTVPDGPQRGAVILRALGFGVVRVVGLGARSSSTSGHCCGSDPQWVLH